MGIVSLFLILLNGGGNSGHFRGAIVANEVTVSGNMSIAYDEKLADLAIGTNALVLGEWKELYEAEERYDFDSVDPTDLSKATDQ